jgi:endonuclease/exonuclease/phosphatase family metal-dependent hydrolase
MLFQITVILLISNCVVAFGPLYIVGERNGKIDPDLTDYGGSLMQLDSLFIIPKNLNSTQLEEEDGVNKNSNDSIPSPSPLPLYFGGALLKYEKTYETLDANFLKPVESIVRKTLALDTTLVESESSFDIDTCIQHELVSTVDLTNPHELHVGNLDHKTRTYINKHWRPTPIGWIFALKVIVYNKEGKREDNGNEERKIIVNMDRGGHASLFLNIQEPKKPELEKVQDSVSVSVDKVEAETTREEVTKVKQANLRIATFNLWHHNPPSWVTHFHDLSTRRKRYLSRLKHFARELLTANPDVILVQEVRLDNTFTTHSGDSGNQMEHLLNALNVVEKELLLELSLDKCKKQEQDTDTCGANASSVKTARLTRWNYVFQPAMSLVEKGNYGQRHEEGCAILSKHPLDQVSALFLPRWLNNPDDGHSRTVLKARVQLPANNHAGYIYSDVLTSHFALHVGSRERGIKFFLDTSLGTGAGTSDNVNVQVFGGDLNAEPEENGIRTLQETCTSSNDCYMDTFLSVDPTTLPFGGLTFPTCNPVKRIDYLFVRNVTNSGQFAKVTNHWLIGIYPADTTSGSVEVDVDGSVHVNDPYRREGLGMLDEDSLLWASDHFGVVADIVIESKEKC